MSSEEHNSPLHNPEASPFSEPQSPGIPHLHHHPATGNHDDPTYAAGLRRRHQGGSGDRSLDASRHDASSSSSMRVRVQTPFSESGESRRKEVVLDRSMLVSRLKDDLASGRWGDEGWTRDGMRLVWRGRIIRDDETLGDVVRDTADNVHTFHLVARRSASPTRPPRPSLDSLRGHTNRPTDAPTTVDSTEATLRPPRDRTSIALQDSLHYLYFIARHHLCLLLDAQPLVWGETVPPPLIDQEVAEQAVKSVIKGVAQTRMGREEGWEEWEQAFTMAESIIARGRSALEDEIRARWSDSVGRPWSDDKRGNEVPVELDLITYTLNLPPFSVMTDHHLAHLLIYLRITSLIPLFIPIVEHESRPSDPRPAVPLPTRVIPAPQRQDQVRVLMRLRIPLIPASVLTHMAYSALKIAAILWMLCRDMRWGDVRFWIMAGAAAGWWVGDGLNAWVRERPRVVVRPDAGPPFAGAAAPGGNGNGAGRQAGNGVAQPGGVDGVPPANPARTAQPPSFAFATAFVPLIHLSTDSAQLGHPSTNPGQPVRNPARRLPTRLQTQFLLPIALWFVTLIPEWETVRARAIRQRERAMRVVVGESTNASAAEGNASGDEGEREHVYPEFLNSVAKRYYERVMRRGEGVDWEEEREAQRAMGIPDEDAGGDGDEMRMRML